MRTSGWVAGMFGIIDGLVALIHNEVFVVTEDTIVLLDLTTWGWVHSHCGYDRPHHRAGRAERPGLGASDRRNRGDSECHNSARVHYGLPL